MHFDWTALGTWATFFATCAIGAFVYGRLTEKVAGHEARIVKLEAGHENHAFDLRRHGEDIASIKAHLQLEKQVTKCE